MTVPNVPITTRVPGFYVNFDNSRAIQGPSLLRYKALLIGGRVSGGSRAEKILDTITSYDQARDFYGEGSELALMFKTWFKNNKTTDVFGMALDDAAGGVVATSTITIVGTATADGSLVFYVGGQRIAVAIDSGENETAIAVKIVAAVIDEMPVTAANTAGVVTFTAKNKGEAGNDIPIDVNRLAGEELAAGVTAAIVQMASGANNPLLSDVIALIGDEWYNIFCAPYTDATNLSAIETELALRFGPLKQIDGLYLSSVSGTVGSLGSFGNGRNSKHVSIIHGEKIGSSGFEMAATFAGVIASEAQDDPARPFQTSELITIQPPIVTERFTQAENNTLLFDGISTFYVDNGGKVRIQRAITMYQTNVSGAPDPSYLDVTTLLTLMFMRFDFNSKFSSRFPKAKLADDGVQVGPGQVVVTPLIAKAFAVSIARGWERLGLIENVDQFKNDIIATRVDGDVNRLEFQLPPDLMNQLRVVASNLQFLL